MHWASLTFFKYVPTQHGLNLSIHIFTLLNTIIKSCFSKISGYLKLSLNSLINIYGVVLTIKFEVVIGQILVVPRGCAGGQSVECLSALLQNLNCSI